MSGVGNASGGVVVPPLAENCSLFKALDFVDEMTCHDYYPLLVAAVNVGCSILCYKVSVDTILILMIMTITRTCVGLSHRRHKI